MEPIFQLTFVAPIVLSGPAAIFLLAARGGDMQSVAKGRQSRQFFRKSVRTGSEGQIPRGCARISALPDRTWERESCWLPVERGERLCRPQMGPFVVGLKPHRL